jgi:hypothetical protein
MKPCAEIAEGNIWGWGYRKYLTLNIEKYATRTLLICDHPLS